MPVGVEVLGKEIIIRFLFLERGKIKMARVPKRKREICHSIKSERPLYSYQDLWVILTLKTRD